MSRTRKTIAERFDPRSNSLNFIRLLLATAVIVAHSTPIGGFSVYFMVGDFDLGRMAVAGFFGISGYLITRSRMRSSTSSYVVKRAARIFPGYWACLLVTAFALAASASLMRGGWDGGSALRYVVSNIDMSGGTQGVGTTLEGVPYPHSWNGSLWTLRYEVFCYAAIGLMLALGWVKRNRLLIFISFLTSTMVTLVLTQVGGPPVLVDLLTLATVFLAGATLYFCSDWIPLSGTFALTAGVGLVGVSFLGYGPALGGMFIAYLCLYAGVALPHRLRRVNVRNDVSYGMYLYGFPVQQMLVIVGANSFGHVAFLVASIAFTIPIAWASWVTVEKPAMNLAENLLARRKRNQVKSEA